MSMCQDVFLWLSHVLENVLTLLIPRYVSDALMLEKYTYRVFNKEGEKVKAYYTPKNCNLGSI